jgi:hypothetical protein
MARYLFNGSKIFVIQDHDKKWMHCLDCFFFLIATTIRRMFPSNLKKIITLSGAAKRIIIMNLRHN